MNSAIEIPGRGWLCALLAGALLAGAAQTRAQDTGSGKPAAAAPAPGAKKPAASAKGAAGAAAGDSKSQASYGIGVSMGERLKSLGLSTDSISVERVAQGIRDALNGKAKFSETDEKTIDSVITTARAGLLEKNHAAAAAFLAQNAQKKDVVTTASGLQYKVIAPGNGASPKMADEVMVNYKGSLLDGSVFDASEKHGGPQPLPVGRVIPGWTEALLLMKPGAKYQLFIPPKLAYDANSPSPAIPPGSMLLFDVELVSIKHPAAAQPPPGGPAPGGAAPPPPPPPSSK
jgi:FKBP-type peptidyl-prolyl cis-trans isomerase FklB